MKNLKINSKTTLIGLSFKMELPHELTITAELQAAVYLDENKIVTIDVDVMDFEDIFYRGVSRKVSYSQFAGEQLKYGFEIQKIIKQNIVNLKKSRQFIEQMHYEASKQL
jgi:hypothetical protein